MSLLLRVGVRHQLGLDDGNVWPVAGAAPRLALQLLPHHHHLAPVVQLLHEVPSLQPSHPGNVNVVHKQDFITNFQNAILISSTS